MRFGPARSALRGLADGRGSALRPEYGGRRGGGSCSRAAAVLQDLRDVNLIVFLEFFAGSLSPVQMHCFGTNSYFFVNNGF